MASKRIKGITIEIGADTRELTDEVKKAEKQISDAAFKLRDVNKLLKLDPKNTELLTQKQKYLTEAIEGTRDKLQKEKEALEQLKKGPQTDEAINNQEALTREIVETEKKLESLESEYKQFGSVAKQQTVVVEHNMKEIGDKIKDAGGAIKNVGEGLTKGVTLPIVGVAAASVSAFNEVDQGLDIVATKTGALGDDLKDLQKEAKDLFRTMNITAEDAGVAVGGVNTRFGFTGERLEDVSRQFLEFANINDTDVNTAIDSVDSIMKKFNIDGRKAAEVLGLMTRAGQRSGISMETLEGALEKNGASLQELGFGLEESINLLAQMEGSGIDVATAMQALKKSVQSAAKEGKSADEALQETITSIKTAATETEALQIAQAAFGAKGATEMVAAIRSGRLSVEDLKSSLSSYRNVVDETFEATQDAPDKAAIALNNLKVAGAELAESGFTALAPALEKLIEDLQKAVDWFSSLDESTKENIVKLGAFAAAIGPVLMVIGNVVKAIGSIVCVIGKIPALVGAVSGGLSAIGGALSSVFASASTALAGVGTALSGLLAPIALVAAAIAVWVHNWDEIWEAGGLLVERTQEHLLSIKEDWINAQTAIAEYTSAKWEEIKANAAAFGEGLKIGLQAVWNFISNIFSEKIEFIKGVMDGGFEFILQSVTAKTQGIFTSIQTTFENLGKFVEGFIEGTKLWGQHLIDNIKLGIESKVGALKSAVTGVGETIKERLHFSEPDVGPLADFNSWMPDMMNQMAQQIAAGIPGVAGAVQNVASTMAEGFQTVDYSQQLSGINQSVQGLATAGAGGDIVVPVYIGNTKMGQAVASANMINTYRSGGR